MSNYSKIYWLTRLDGFHTFACVMIFVSVMTLFIFFGSRFLLCETDQEITNHKKFNWIKNTAFSCIFIGIFGVLFLPTKDDMIEIYAGGKTMDFVQSDTSLAKLPSQTTKFISTYIDKQLKELNK